MAGEIQVVRATPYRIATLAADVPASILASAHGWSRVEGDITALSVATGTAGCVLRSSDDGALSVLVHMPDGTAVGPLDADSAQLELARAVEVFGLPDGATVLHRALTATSPWYDPPTRLADACRALGVPLQLVTAAGPAPPAPVQTAAILEVGVVLVHATVTAAAADAPLTGHAAWTVPLGDQWSLHAWDGSDEPPSLIDAAVALAGKQRTTLAYWWSGRTAGFLLTRRNRVAAAHEWGGEAPKTAESIALAGEALAEEFRLPGQAPTVAALLRDTDRTPEEALAALCQLLRLPAEVVGRTYEDLAVWAVGVPGAVHTDRLGFASAVAHAVREAPPSNVFDDLSKRRPMWYRLVNGLVAVVMGLSTALLALLWHWHMMSGWWVLGGIFTTLSYAWGLRPGRQKKLQP
jgi:hypothetical protein